MSVSRLEGAVYQARNVLTASPAGLITDIDGTISRIVSVPEGAVVSERVKESLSQLAGQLALVAVVTAREESVARQMVQVPELTYVGNYGLSDKTRASAAELEPVKSSVRMALVDLPCVLLEDKGVSFAVHYRNCAEEGVRERLLDLIAPLAEEAGARVLEGKQVIEVVPADLPNKASAVGRLVDEKGLKGLVYLGDDLSDLPVFKMIEERRGSGLQGLAIGVIDEETHVDVAETADLQLAGVDMVEDFLANLPALLGRKE